LSLSVMVGGERFSAGNSEEPLKINKLRIGSRCGQHSGRCFTTGGQCGQHPRPMWTAPETDVDGTRGRRGQHRRRCFTTGDRCFGAGDRCGHYRRPMWRTPEIDVENAGGRSFGAQ
jgi:hypothetical protein